MTTKSIDVTLDCRASIEAQKIMKFNGDNRKVFEVTYKFISLESPEHVFIAVAKCNGTTDAICLGVERNRAEYIFSLICEHGIMPGFLSETISDLDI